VAFPVLPQDQELKRTWRGSEHADWTLILGHEEYRIHKVIAATGEYASHFLAGAFRRHCGKQNSTNLTDLIPQRCWQNFEAVLEFLYSGEVALTADNWAAMLKMSDLLQIVSLYKKCVELGGELCSKESAPRLAADTVELQLGSELEEQVVQMALDVITPSFMSYLPKDLAILPVKVLQQLLRRSDLEVLNEGIVFRFLLFLNNENVLELEDFPELWKCCRLEELSQESVLEAAKIPHVPKEAFAWALAQKAFSASSQPLAAPAWACEWIGKARRGREILFKVRNPVDFLNGRGLRSPEHQLDDKFKWSLLVYPMGTEVTGHPNQVAAFVELTPEANVGEKWTMKDVQYEITLVNWKDEQRSVTKEHVFNFCDVDVDNGWHRGWATPDILTHANGFLNESGELGFRARISSRASVFTQGRSSVRPD